MTERQRDGDRKTERRRHKDKEKTTERQRDGGRKTKRQRYRDI